MHPHTFISMFHINSNLGIPYFLDKANCFSVFQAYSSPFFRQMRAKKRREMGHFPSRLTHCTSRVAPNDRKKTWKIATEPWQNPAPNFHPGDDMFLMILAEMLWTWVEIVATVQKKHVSYNVGPPRQLSVFIIATTMVYDTQITIVHEGEKNNKIQ